VGVQRKTRLDRIAVCIKLGKLDGKLFAKSAQRQFEHGLVFRPICLPDQPRANS
jgi:hypothetical protein